MRLDGTDIMLLGNKPFELPRTDRLARHMHFSSSSLRTQCERRDDEEIYA